MQQLRADAWRQHEITASRLPDSSEKEQTFDTFIRTADNEKALEAARAMKLDGQYALLLLYGTSGVGKTHLAWAVGWEFLNNGWSVEYFQAEELLDEIRATLSNGEQYLRVIDRLRNVNLLIIDDVGAQSETAWGNAKLDMLIDFRCRQRRCTIVTSNNLGLTPRTLDRMKEGRIIQIKGDSWRGRKVRSREC